MRARSLHGPTVLVGAMSLGARPPYAIAALMGATPLRPPQPQGLRLPRAIDGTPIARPHLLFQFVSSSHSITDCSGIGLLYCTTSRYATSCCGAGYPHYRFHFGDCSDT
jgi:hypothetical protein